MAEMIDELTTQEPAGELETVESQLEAQKTAPPPRVEPDEEIPQEFRGKSAAEIARIAQHARREMGRQANELGEVRKLADELLRSSLVKKPEPEEPKEVDFFENPQEAIRRAVETNPRVLAAEQYAIQSQRQQAQQAMMQKHPDVANVVQDPEFQQWISASKVRTKLFQQAEAYDVDAADEILSTYKELRVAKQQFAARQTSEADTKARDTALRSAAVETGGSGESTRKVYRRADLIRLKMTDPAKYESMNDEILTAYAEGRVK